MITRYYNIIIKWFDGSQTIITVEECYIIPIITQIVSPQITHIDISECDLCEEEKNYD